MRTVHTREINKPFRSVEVKGTIKVLEKIHVVCGPMPTIVRGEINTCWM